MRGIFSVILPRLNALSVYFQNVYEKACDNIDAAFFSIIFILYLEESHDKKQAIKQTAGSENSLATIRR